MPVSKQTELGDNPFYRERLDELVASRTAELTELNAHLEHEVLHWKRLEHESRQHEEDLRHAIDESPAPLLLVRFSDSKILYLNHRASSLLRVNGASTAGQSLPQFWVNPEERHAFVHQLRGVGRVEGFIAEIKTASEPTRWVQLSAQCLMYEGNDCYMLSLCDITSQKLAEDAVRQSARSIRALFASAPVPLMLSSLEDKRVLIANTRAADLFELSLPQMSGSSMHDYYADPKDLETLTSEARGGRVENFETLMRTRSGQEFWASISARILEFDYEAGLMSGFVDITSHKLLEGRLRELATRDPLTLAYNRRHFLEICGIEIERARRHSHPLSICMLDADHFKSINDEFGHSVGDQVLQELCRACREDLRSSDVLSRVGGEEFVILFPNTKALGAQTVTERIRTRIAAQRLFTHDGRNVSFTVSGGVCELLPSDTLESLLRRADDAMYAAKRAGRNRVVLA